MQYISLGYFCSIAMELEKMGLRSESSPFDWLISDFDGVISAIETRFEDFLNPAFLAQNKNNRSHYKNTKYNIEFFHDLTHTLPCKTNFRTYRKNIIVVFNVSINPLRNQRYSYAIFPMCQKVVVV